MKALIPVAGAGTRLRPHTYTQPKPLIPVAGKPIISFIIDQLVSVGIKDFVFVIGYLGEKIKLYIEQQYPDLNISFVQQNERLGLGHAVWSAREELADTEDIFIVLGDTIFDLDLSRMMAEPTSCLAIKRVDTPWEFGVAEISETGYVEKVVEKPKIPKSNMALVGLYKIKEVQGLLNAIKYNIDNNIRTVGEFQLTDGIMRMIEKGVKFRTVTVDNWFDCGKKEVLLETNTMLLKRKKYATQHIPKFEDAIIIPPVSLGKNCKIKHSIVGPNVAVGDNASIEFSIVKNSIIGNYAHLNEVVLHKSVVGADASIKGLSQSLNIGDNTEMDFSGSIK